jgi:membrane fusion protein, multidrug efflux system
MPEQVEEDRRQEQAGASQSEQPSSANHKGGGNAKKDDSADKGDNEQEEEEKPVDPAKRRRIIIIAAIVGIVLVIGAVLWYLHSQTYESTDDAQIDGHLNAVSARVNGTIKSVYIENNQYIEAGKLLVELDGTDTEISLAQARAQQQQALAQLQGQQPNVPITATSNRTDTVTADADIADADAAVAGAQHDYQSDVADLRQSEANNAKAQTDLKRYKQLLDRHEIAESEYDQYDATAKAQAAAVAARQAKVSSSLQTVSQRQAQLRQKQAARLKTVENAPRQIQIRNADVAASRANAAAAAAQVQQQEMNLAYCRVVAPVAGLVSQRTVEVGARVAIGQQLLLIVQTKDLWVTANFKETQLKKVRVGQRVTMEVDGLDKKFDGYVESLPASTGDRTSALPPQNATGNFVKVVQRMPLRIRFRDNQNGLDQLRTGMSVVPTIHFD